MPWNLCSTDNPRSNRPTVRTTDDFLWKEKRMLARLALKEIRETAWIAGLALAANLFFVVVFTGVGLPEEMWGERYLYPRLPFPDGANVSFIVIAMCLAALLGLRQSLGEAVFGTYQFLLNRPASRNRLIGMKLLVG
ncbi:MAG TPA: hypothetical protein DD670_21205, partial [Planctomycetaceae bacterium]|nr:hypothetical protein [Planctomycetaceae bacterium]